MPVNIEGKVETRGSRGADQLLRMEGITKSFPGVQANEAVSFDVVDGEIHALLGENGAGKSTLMRVLYGMTAPDDGTVYWRGNPVRITSSHVAIDLGIGMVHQHFMLIPEFTVVENVVLGLHTARSPLLDLQSASKRLQELSKQFGLAVDPWATVKDLSTGERQRVEIVKALYRGAHLLILDEPTAVLTPGEVDDLFVTLRSLCAHGHAVVLITHKLNEVMAVSDRVTVLRGGRTIATVQTAQSSKEDLACLMVGRPVCFGVDNHSSRAGSAVQVAGSAVIGIENAQVRTPDQRQEVHDISLTVHAGEIVALAGVAGNGQSTLIEALFGLRPLTAGTISLFGRAVGRSRPRDLVELNVGRIPEDRQSAGLAMKLSVRENLVLEVYNQAPYQRGGILNGREIGRLAGTLQKDYDIRTSSLEIPAGKLSGGNQQKVILAREMHRKPQALIAVNPTRGLDVGATEFVYEQLLAARNLGVAILLVSTDLEEIFCLSDRVAVIYNGKIVGWVSGNSTNETQLGLMMAGVQPETVA